MITNKTSTLRLVKATCAALSLVLTGAAATSVVLVPAAYAKGKRADDGAGHDKNDDRGGKGADDPAGHH